MTRLIVKFINFYQLTFSPDHSVWGKRRFPHGYCRFHPSCSEYCRQSLLKYGWLRGAVKSGSRILRCNPFSAGGIDLVK